MPHASAGPASIRRRDLLLGLGRGAAGLALLAVTASACGSPPPQVDDLQGQLDLANDDTELARTAATAAVGPLVPALTQIASERAEHAQALAREIARAAGQPEPTATTTTTATTATTVAAPPPAVKDVVAALRRSANSATQLAATQSGYRAGLLGSIAASCTASFSVALNAPKAAT